MGDTEGLLLGFSGSACLGGEGHGISVCTDMGGCAGGKVREGWMVQMGSCMYVHVHASSRFRENQIFWQRCAYSEVDVADAGTKRGRTYWCYTSYCDLRYLVFVVAVAAHDN